ncbi:MAG TPA: bifunctional lysylphosphatidylglycerol flippase/synthetase MprF [Gammaproteobacteria bacterium]|mgnify:CR=1 FL=1|nr:bifunctional lysylphosphatidylglycerol flippase/synthetase MprF [Gammaproteobacteria bacterium]
MTASDLAAAWARWRGALLAIAALALVALCGDALRALAQELDYAAIAAAVRATAWRDLLAALLATLVSYLALSGYDRSALRVAGIALPWRSVAQISFVAYALGNTMGVGVLTGGAVRMRMYAAAGLEAGVISHVIAFNAVAFGWGIAAIAALGLVAGARDIAAALALPPLLLQLAGAAVLLASAALCGWLGAGRRLRLLGREFDLPSGTVALRQLAISGLDIVAAAAALWWLLPGEVAFPAFVGCYAVATALGVLSHVPGGLGVFEALMFVALRGQVASEALAGALVLYRLVYYVAPLALALVLLAISELRRGLAAPVLRAATSVAPLLLTAYTLLAAVMLLLSGVLPATDEAAALLALSVPLPLVEASHFLGSIAGLALLIVARGMLQRLDAAWWAGLVLALVSLVLAFPKGIAWSEAGFLAVLVVALLLSRRRFTRRASLFAQPFTPGWLFAIGAVLAVVTSLLWFVYRDVAYSHELWWQFEFDAHAPRALRAMLAVDVLALAFALRQLLRPPPPPLELPDAAALERARRAIEAQDEADACLALTGDKHLLFADADRAFVMFGVRGRSWIALFDPIGAEDQRPELVWRFIGSAREAGARASFYQVRAAHLALYLDAGLRAFKLGEYAQVPLAHFSLRGKARQDLRSAVNRAEREGLRFEVLPPAAVRARLPALRAISDAWLAAHAAAEKRYSLGAFDEDYVCRLPLALVSCGDEPLAFATLMTTATRQAASVDLMRQRTEAPRGTMDFLFARLLLHFQAEGYARFGLGMAPLSGMATHPLAPHWHRIGRLLYAHGEHFYNFQGLRAFKDKFAPVWEPRYLACPGGVAPLLVLADVAALIGGGYKRMVSK